MPWSEGRVDERKRMVALWEAGATPTELAERYGVSRPTIYEAIRRWQEEGAVGLKDRTRRPHSSPHQTGWEVTAALLNLKDQHPGYGPDKLVRLLLDDGIVLAASTARDILKRNGRVEARRARPPRWSPAASPTIVVPGVGHSMSGDYKGQFRLGNGRYCFALTIADPASRYLYAVDGHMSTTVRPAIRVFERVFREWGLPEQIITDNGVPFCTARAIGGLTELSKWWIRLGIQHVRIQPGRPQQNGIHERMHRTLKREAIRPPKSTMPAQQRAFDHFRHEFNNIRPHESLGQERPSSFVKPYRRPYPERLSEIEYPMSFTVRRVRGGGMIKWRGELLFISAVLVGESVAMLQLDDDRWALFFGPVHLATWNERSRKFETPGNLLPKGVPASPARPDDPDDV